MKYYIFVPIIAAVIFAVCFFAIGNIIQTGDDQLQKIQWPCMWGGRGDGPAGGPRAYSDGTQTIDDIICKWMPNEDYAKYYESRTHTPMNSMSPKKPRPIPEPAYTEEDLSNPIPHRNTWESEIQDNVSPPSSSSSSKWTLEGHVIPLIMKNIVLDYIRAEYGNQKILMYISTEDKSSSGLIEFAFPKEAASLVFDDQNCSIFDGQNKLASEFFLQVDQKPVGASSATQQQGDVITLSIQIPPDSSVIEVFSSKCSALGED